TTLATPAFARDGEGYFGAEVGYVDPEAHKFYGPGDGPTRVKDSDGAQVGAFVGYDWGKIRTEAEVAYSQFHAKRATDLQSGASESLGGKDALTTAMVNALFDVGGQDCGIALALGAGAGRAFYHTRLDDASGSLMRDSDSAWAYQLIGQARLRVSNSGEIALTYKYLNTNSFHLHDLTGVPHWTELKTSTALISLISNFGGAAPPPPPPP